MAANKTVLRFQLQSQIVIESLSLSAQSGLTFTLDLLNGVNRLSKSLFEVFSLRTWKTESDLARSAHDQNFKFKFDLHWLKRFFSAFEVLMLLIVFGWRLKIELNLGIFTIQREDISIRDSEMKNTRNPSLG